MKQEKALAILKAGHNIFLTGSAGSGKTYCLNQYIAYLHDCQVPVAVTASTGIAATHMGGTTIHSWSGIGISNTLDNTQLNKLATRSYLQHNMKKVRVLIIDEISMLHRCQFELVDRVLRFFKGNDVPFGGIQVVFSGDFFQLPPITQGAQSGAEKFCFMSPLWVSAALKVCYLTDQYRSADNQLDHLLNDIRAQQMSAASHALLERKIREGRRSPDRFPHLYPHNANVDAINARELLAMPGDEHTFTAVKQGNPALADTLMRNILAPEVLTLKIGAKVMFVKNNPDKQVFNGTLGEVSGFDDKGVAKIRLLDGREVFADAEMWQVENELGIAVASVTQVPLRLAWAMTVHKSQGMTLDEASIDLSKTFERGQGYVALSRLKHIDGLRLLGINDIALKLDPLALKADARFRQLSDEYDTAHSFEQLAQEWHGFILRSGGETDPQKRAVAKLAQAYGDTTSITKALLQEGHSIEQIANLRGIKVGTVLQHLNELKHDPELDMATHVVRDEKLIGTLQSMIGAQTTDEPLRLKPIYEALNGQYSYEEIKKALLFIPY